MFRLALACVTVASVSAASLHSFYAAAAPAPIGEVSCAELDNGPHATTVCGNKYIDCWNGVGHYRECPSGLFFSPYNGYCDYKTNISDCVPGKKITFTKSPSARDATESTTAATQPSTKDSPAVTNAPCGLKTTTTSPLKDTPCQSIEPATVAPIDPAVSEDKYGFIDGIAFCKGKKTGFYGLGCHNRVYFCYNGDGYTWSYCAEGEFYDAESHSCTKNKSLIIGCGASPKTVDFCKERENGVYGRGCRTFYFICNNGIATKMNCSEGMIYDSENKRCIVEGSNLACGNYNAKDFICSSYSENHSHGCSGVYYTCAFGSRYVVTCEDISKRFDASRGICDFPWTVPQCGGVAPFPTIVCREKKIFTTTTTPVPPKKPVHFQPFYIHN